MISSSSELPKPCLQMKQDGKVYSRLLSKESSMANSSFRVYHGVASGAVPFLWESQPGTPKHTISVADLPPLTPPPSYYYYNVTGCKNSRRSPKSSLLRTILPRLCLGKPHRRPLSPRSSFSWTGDDDEESNDGDQLNKDSTFKKCLPQDMYCWRAKDQSLG
ncbi:hypothetical protein OPV22_017091 [Ensete ventricosum]|uniref:Uncharacterized protein n=1 Tax=Ensete ventricosum TaxID=4639 RepID=A0AAV8QSA3_ENSVE|nr:hypothetical protein OPV22_017091 [Ensete ventricosum]